MPAQEVYVIEADPNLAEEAYTHCRWDPKKTSEAVADGAPCTPEQLSFGDPGGEFVAMEGHKHYTRNPR